MSERRPFHHPRVRPEWLAKLREDILDPGQPICDPHHHLWQRSAEDKYLLADVLADVDCGHNIVSTVYLQARSMHRAGGPEELRPVGETEFVVVHGGHRVDLSLEAGRTFSLIALHGPAEGVVVRGARWELDGARLTGTEARGVSNVVEDELMIAVEQGVVTAVIP